MTVHKEVGPGFLENIYHECMKIELSHKGIAYRTEYSKILVYRGQKLETTMRCDLFVEESIVVELKAVSSFAKVHEAQVLAYMKLLNAYKGILLNFQSANLFHEGQKTFVSEDFRHLPV